jgi:3-hydroxymyristoyl/3-hydroxydecanoyl-(acyl carrier protein) dehydratase
VKQIPRNTQGKVEQQTLRQLFSTGSILPEWHQVEASLERWVGEAMITANLAELEGHFPDRPIVPGVTQLSWIALAARRAFQLDSVSGALEALKFSSPLLPGARVRMTLILSAHKVSFEISDDVNTYSSGRMIVGAG